MVAMWGFLAARYANVSNILGYEVFSEPRTLNATQVHQFHVDACGAVWDQDPRAACLIGAGKFYDRYQLDERFIIKDRPVIYAANYLTPKRYTKGALRTVEYPGSKIKCGDLLETKEIPHACPGGDGEAEIAFNKDFLRILAKPLSEFKSKFNVPLWVDQWGIYGGGVGGGDASITAYIHGRRSGPVGSRELPLDTVDLEKSICKELFQLQPRLPASYMWPFLSPGAFVEAAE
jgi:hypothetical protein